MSQWQLEQIVRDILRRLERMENEMFKQARTSPGKNSDEIPYKILAAVFGLYVLYSLDPGFLKAITDILKVLV